MHISSDISLLIMIMTFLLCVNESSMCNARVYIVKSRNMEEETNTKACKAHAIPELHVLMDRVCQLCHEMFSHAMPNFRAECSQRCYKNTKFRNCLKMFSVLPPEHPASGNNNNMNLLRIENDDDKDDADNSEEEK